MYFFDFVVLKLMVCFNIKQEGGGEPPKGSLGSAIDTHFGSLEGLVKKMSAEGAAVQGSGWVVCTLFSLFNFICSLFLLWCFTYNNHGP